MHSNSRQSHLYYPKDLGDAPKYIFSGVSSGSDLIFVPDFTMQPKSFLRKVLKFLFVGRIPLKGSIIEMLTGYKGYAWLKTLKPGDRLLLNGVTNIHTMQAVTWLVPHGVRLYNYFNNCLRFLFTESDIIYRISKMKEMGYELMTFDPKEAYDFGMTYTEQFYRFPKDNGEEYIKFDFFFCGVSKDRSQRLSKLKEELEGKGFRCKFMVIPPMDRISYEEYLLYVRQSRCLVDMMQKGQVGLTRRPIEALFFGKKLITENENIKDYDFYDPANIHVFNINNIEDIVAFMKVKPKDIPMTIKAKYEVNHWLEYFK